MAQTVKESTFRFKLGSSTINWSIRIIFSFIFVSKLEVDIQLKCEIIRLKLALSILRILKLSAEISLFIDSMFKCIWFSLQAFVLSPSSWVHTCISLHLYMTASSEKFTHSSTGSTLLICLLSYLKIRLIAL